MSGRNQNFKGPPSAKKMRSSPKPPKKTKVEPSTPKKKKLKQEAEKAKEKQAQLRFGKADITLEEASRMNKAQKRELYAAAAARSAAHREMDRYEDDNVGTAALNEGSKGVETAQDIRKGRYARKLKKRAKAQAKRRAEAANAAEGGPHTGPDTGSSNWLSRWRQKQDIRRGYYAAARANGAAAKTAGGQKAAYQSAATAKSGIGQAVEKGRADCQSSATPSKKT